MLIDAEAELGLDLGRSWMIGDAERDIEAGIAAGCRTVLVDNPASAQRRPGKIAADVRADSFAGAISTILEQGR